YDVLADIKLRPDPRIVRVLPDEENKEQSNEPLAMELSKFIDDYCEKEWNVDGFAEFKRQFEPGSMIDQSMEQNEGLARASFVLVRWAKYIGGMQECRRFNEEHLVALFILFGLGEVHVRGTKRRFIQRPTGEVREHLKKGEHLLLFIDYLSSREFRTSTHVSFADIMPGVLMRGEWKTFGELCIPAYLSLVTTHQLSLPMNEENEIEAIRSAFILKEYEPRKMELPSDVVKEKLGDVRRDLIKATGCRDVQLRPLGNKMKQTARDSEQILPKSEEVFVSAIGTTETFKKLNDLVISPAPSRNQANNKDVLQEIANMVYKRLVRAASKADLNSC
ncbi:hypothetical protein PENTCL1PPCAC_7883, partial [Pristionchus entomophagus]